MSSFISSVIFYWAAGILGLRSGCPVFAVFAVANASGFKGAGILSLSCGCPSHIHHNSLERPSKIILTISRLLEISNIELAK